MTYRTGQKSFADFMVLYPNSETQMDPPPASQTALLEWVEWLGGAKRLQPKTIKSYIIHLQSVHVDAGLSFSACESPMLQRVIRGIKRYMGECECSPKLPIMLSHSISAQNYIQLLTHAPPEYLKH